ncbi:MAG: type II toxin-antitoxin system PemK/MazF family toxin [Aestuariivita sp.]|nr:type II toxin-antitoxin system PemK/MazF family toxin [Aestuariivita sp.]
MTIEKPQRETVKLQASPRKREVYWCDYPPSECLHLPEFWKRRPVVVVSRHATLSGVVTVVPITSKRQPNPQFSVMIRSPLDGRDAWIVCNHVTTMAVSRLLPSCGKPLISEEEYRDVIDKIIGSLARA